MFLDVNVYEDVEKVTFLVNGGGGGVVLPFSS
jgi:hypothetical protein